MSLFDVGAILLVLTAFFSFVNVRYIRLPTMIGVMFLSLAASLALALFGGVTARHYAGVLLSHIDFNQALLHGMLAFLLFAAALNLEFNDLAREWGAITILSLIGTAVSTFAVAGGLWLLLRGIGSPVSFLHCLLFGALISPTDPIAVIGILKSAGAPKQLGTLLAGESLFNDGVGVVFFFVLLALSEGGGLPSTPGVVWLLVWKVLGGIVTGLLAGLLTHELLRRVDHYQVEVLLTLALATGGYAFAEAIGVSAPIAIVVAGLLTGNQGRSLAMSSVTREHIDTFWELLDETLNAVLFMLIGLQVLVTPFRITYALAGTAAIALCLLARWVSVDGLVRLMRIRRTFCPGTVTVLTWGGLRGGLSVAMALSLPHGAHRDLLVSLTYCVVVFSVLIQGLTIAPVTSRACGIRRKKSPVTV